MQGKSLRARFLITNLVVLGLFLSAPHVSSAPPGGTVRRFELPNGLRVIIQPSRKADTVSLHLGVRVGSIDEGEHLGKGLSHYLEHMLFKGTSKRGAGQIEEDVRRMGGTTNAYTSYDYTVYYLNCLSAYAPEALELLADAAFESVFPPEEFKKEREVILAEFRMNDDRLDREADVELWKLAFQEHPYGHPVIGYRPLFEQVTREELAAYYRRYYVPNNMVLVVVGDVDPRKTEGEIRRFFGSAKFGGVTREAKPPEPPQIMPRRKILRKATPHARLVIGYPGVAATHPDAALLDVVSTVLGGGASSRLEQRLKETDRSALEVDAFNATLKYGGLFGVHVLAVPEKLEEAALAVRREVRRLADEGVTAGELERVKNQVLAAFYQSRETHASLAHDYLTSEIYAGDYRFSEVYVERVRGTKPEDLVRAARFYLREEAENEVRIYPDGEAPDEDSGGPAAVPARTPFRKEVLPNGLTVILERDAASPDFVIQFAMQGGVRCETPRTNGSSELVSKLLTRGTSSKSQARIADLVEGWGGSVEGFSGQNSLGLALTALSGYRAPALDLFMELLRDPAFPEEEIAKVKIIQRQTLRARSDDVFGYATQALRRSLFVRHPYGLDPLGTEESLDRIGREDVAAFWRGVFRPERSVLMVSGDIDPDETLRRVRELAGPWAKGTGGDPHPPAEALGEVREVTEEVRREQAIVMVAFPGIRLTDERRVAFEALNAVMNGSAGRLYRQVRSRFGLSYVTGSHLVMGMDPGYFVLYASVEPAKTKETRELLLQEAEALRSQGITEEEFRDAQRQLLGDHAHALEAKASRAAEYVFSELYGIGAEAFRDYPERVRALTREDVMKTVREFVDPSRSVRLVVRPAAQTKQVSKP